MARKADSNWRVQDPHLRREIERYGEPVPSREFIADYLERRRRPLSLEQLCRELDLEGNWQQEAVSRRLRAMARDGQLIRNRCGDFGTVRKMDLVPGRVIGHPEGFGFLVPDEGGEDLYLPTREMRTLMHGDRAVMRVQGIDRRGRREGALVEVLERNTHRLVGRFRDARGVAWVEPDNRRYSQEIAVPRDARGEARDGQIVSVEITDYPERGRRPMGRVEEVLGEHMAPGMEVEIAIRTHEIRTEWPTEVVAEAKRFGEQVSLGAKEGRVDLRELPLVTIDGITARDFDDAVYCERRGKNWRLWVAIADVSHYVEPGSALDVEAQARGTSVYFPDRVVPMLPEVLSNGLCSLNPRVDRLCIACDMTIAPDGNLVRSRFVEAVMCSRARLTYDAVARVLFEDDARLSEKFSELVPHLENLREVYRALLSAREKRGAIGFETQETLIEYGADRKIEKIVPSERNEAHKLIEECMIAANVAAARFVTRKRIGALYRVHHGPTVSRLEDLRTFLGELGLVLGGGEKPEPRDYEALLAAVQDRPDRHLIQTVLLRSLARAVYASKNDGHFGLGLAVYGHFTSPIRRYPDLLLHRAIRHLLQGGKGADFRYGPKEMERLGEHCSYTERNADEAVWDAVNWLKCEYMMERVGEEFDGIVTSVTSFGLFVELSDVYVEGLAHVTSLGHDYFHFDAVGHRLQGERSGRVYRLGDEIRVRVVRVDLDDRKIEFEPVVPERGTRSRPRRRHLRRR